MAQTFTRTFGLDDSCFVQDQHIGLDVKSANSLKLQS